MKKFIISIFFLFLAFSANAAVDDSYTKLLLHCNGTDGSSTITDESGKTVTVVNQAQIDTAQKQFGTGSCLFDGTADYLTETDSTDWDFANGDFTYDFWLRVPSPPSDDTYNSLIVQRAGAGSNQATAFFLHRDTGHYHLFFGYTTDGSTQKTTESGEISLSNNTWYHIAFVRNGTTGTFYLDGTANGTTVNFSTDTIYNSTSTNGQARVDSSTTDLNGWIDELRISKGIARWTTNFTPPTEEYAPTPTPTPPAPETSGTNHTGTILTIIMVFAIFDFMRRTLWNH